VFVAPMKSRSFWLFGAIAFLSMESPAFRSLLLRDAFLLERIFRESLRTLIKKERSLIDSLIRSQSGAK
jgi:hypothetical protein